MERAMKITPTTIAGAFVLEPEVRRDDRGFFTESWNQRAFDALVGRELRFVQDNHSHSKRGVLRGLHYQRAPHEQGRLVRVTRGAVFDVAVDLRRASPSFGHCACVELSADNARIVWLPPGLAHGFLALHDDTDFVYKTTAYYHPEAEGCIRWDDPALAIAWPLTGAPLLSPRDAAAPGLAEALPHGL
jgi:dTDP-4-dehydrorhamnose 3,5-epimerase